MQKPQYTHDVAYKFALWNKLLRDGREQEEQVASVGGSGGSIGTSAEARVEAHVLRAATSVVHEFLPRRTYEPCCLNGTCFPSRGKVASPFVHAVLHPGRRSIEPAEGVRDEDCFCLSHSTACLGDGGGSTPLASPLRLVLRGYRSSSGNGKDPWRGLRCLLRHVPLSEVVFSGVGSVPDAEELLFELRALLLSQRNRTGTAGSRGVVLTQLTLCRVAATPRGLSEFVRDAARADRLTSLSLQHVSAPDLADMSAAYLHHSSTLQKLSLCGSRHVDRDGWSALGAAVASCGSLLCLDVSDCEWTEEVLHVFLIASVGFTPRSASASRAELLVVPLPPGLTLNLSENPLGPRVWSLLCTAAPAELQGQLTGLLLSGSCPDGADEGDLPAFFASCPALRSLDVSSSTMSASGMQRLTRCLAEQSQQLGWERVDFSAAAALPPRALKRLTQLPYVPGVGALALCGVDLRDSLLKAGFANCLGTLGEINLCACQLHDEDLQQLAAALEKTTVLPLRALRLGQNDLGADKRKGESALSYLCRALRATHAPSLRVLDLSHNSGLSPRPLLALTEQVSPSLHELVLSSTPITEDAASVAALLSAVAKRQRGGTTLQGFAALDLVCANAKGDFLVTDREMLDWLWHQTTVRFIYKEK